MRKLIIWLVIIIAGFAWLAYDAMKAAEVAQARTDARDTIIERQAAEIVAQQRRIRNLEGTVRDNLRTIEQLLPGGRPSGEQPSRGGVIRHYAKVTAFTAGPESTGKSPGHPAYGVTSSGHRINVGAGEKLAAAGPGIPFGSRVYVPGYGWAPVRDRGGAIGDNDLDVYFDRVEDAIVWGVRRMEVFIVR